MSDLLDLAKRGNIEELESAFTARASAAAPADDAALLETLAHLASHDRAEQAEMLGWAWLSELREKREPADALSTARDLLLAVPSSEQIRSDLVELYRAARADHPNLDAWLEASGLPGGKVPPHRAIRTLELLLGVQTGDTLIERRLSGAERVLAERAVTLTAVDPVLAEATVREAGGRERNMPLLRLADDFEVPVEDDVRVLMQLDRERLADLLKRDPLKILISAIRSAGDQIDNEELREALVASGVMDDADWSKWWSRARTAAKKNKHVIIEGRNPVTLSWHDEGVTLEAETLEAIEKAHDPVTRLGLFETYLRQKAGKPDSDFLAALADHAANWLARRPTLADALIVHQLADLGVPIDEEVSEHALRLLADSDDPTSAVRALDNASLWSIALPLLREARPATEDDSVDWREMYVRLLPYAPADSCQAIADALEKVGQLDRLNARVLKVMAEPVRCVDALCWLWSIPSQADKLDLPRPSELYTKMLDVAKEGTTAVRGRIRQALSARNHDAFRRYVNGISGDLAPLVRRQTRRADGLGQTLPEELVSILDEKHPPIIERKVVPKWLEEKAIYCSQEALAARERELDHIQNVEMPANAKAIGEAASHGDLSENSEYKFALEERDLLRARAARIQNELAMARVLHPGEVPDDHVSIYGRVELEPLEGGERTMIQIVSPWDSDVAQHRYNYKAPLSQALLGKKAGERAAVALGGGEEREYRIRSIHSPAQ